MAKRNWIVGWHVTSGTLMDGDDAALEAGWREEWTPPPDVQVVPWHNPTVPTICECGLHAARSLTDALDLATVSLHGNNGVVREWYVRRVRVGGSVAYGGRDKIVGRTREVLACIKLSDLLGRQLVREERWDPYAVLYLPGYYSSGASAPKIRREGRALERKFKQMVRGGKSL